MNEELSFISRGVGSDLIRYTDSSGNYFQFKTGHSFYRPHRTPDGRNTDLRNTELTPDEIEAEIVADIHLFLDSGGSLPMLGRDFRQPMQKEILVEGHRIAYRAVELPDGSIKYWDILCYVVVIPGGSMNSLIHAGMNVILSQYEPQNSDVEHRFIELLTFNSFDEIVELLDWIDARYWTEFPIWARNLAYRLASLLEPRNAAIRERAAAGLRSFGPDWDDEADRLEAEAARLRMNSRELEYAS